MTAGGVAAEGLVGAKVRTWNGLKATVGDTITSFELLADGHRAGISHG